MKHFFAIVYMVCCVFVMKAQENPIIFHLDVNRLYGYDYTMNTGFALGEIFAQRHYPTYGEWSSIDAFNGRFFCISSSTEQKYNPFKDDSSMVNKAFVTEVNLKNGNIKYYKLPVRQAYVSLLDLHYDPLNNSLIFLLNDSLRTLDLNSGNVHYTAKISPAANFPERKLTLYIPEKEQYLFGHRKTGADTQYVYYIYDLKTGVTKKLFTSPQIIKHFVYSNTFGLLGFREYYHSGNKPDEIISVSWTGETKVLDSLDKFRYLLWGQNAAIYKDKYLLLNGQDRNFLHFNLENNQKTSIFRPEREIRGYSEFHTFNQPYIQTSENTYTSTYGKSYCWLWNNQPIENSNTQTYTPTQCGDYKVEVTHLDGRIDTSEAVHYEARDNKGNLITNTFATAYPNPFHTNLNIQYKTCLDNKVTFKVYDMQGKLVYTHKTPEIPAGEYAFLWHSQAQNLRYGLYIVQVFSGDDLISTQKVLKQ